MDTNNRTSKSKTEPFNNNNSEAQTEPFDNNNSEAQTEPFDNNNSEAETEPSPTGKPHTSSESETDGPVVAPGLDIIELKEKANEEEIEKGDYTSVTSLVVDRTPGD